MAQWVDMLTWQKLRITLSTHDSRLRTQRVKKYKRNAWFLLSNASMSTHLGEQLGASVVQITECNILNSRSLFCYSSSVIWTNHSNVLKIWDTSVGIVDFSSRLVVFSYSVLLGARMGLVICLKAGFLPVFVSSPNLYFSMSRRPRCCHICLLCILQFINLKERQNFEKIQR